MSRRPLQQIGVPHDGGRELAVKTLGIGCLVEEMTYRLVGKCGVEFFEKLRAQPPRSAEPYCCYVNHVIFYRKMKFGKDKIAECDHHRIGFPDHVLLIGEKWYQVMSAKVVYLPKLGWHMQWSARSNTRLAALFNAGWSAYRE